MTDQKELLKQLVDAPFGKAEKILREKGLWDEARVPRSERSLKEYEVTLIGMQPVSATVTVFAKDEDEAKRLAKHEDCDWVEDHFDSIEDIEVSEIEEVLE